MHFNSCMGLCNYQHKQDTNSFITHKSPYAIPLELCVYVWVWVYIERKETYYKNFVYITMEAGKSQNLQGKSGNWRHRRVDGVAPMQRPADSRPRKSWCFSLSPKAGKSLCPTVEAVRLEEFSLLRSGSAFFVQAFN